MRHARDNQTHDSHRAESSGQDDSAFTDLRSQAGNRAFGSMLTGVARSASGGGDSGGSTVPGNVASGIAAAAGSGLPLPDGTRRDMEGQFGVDLSPVRVHTGPTADRLSRSVSAEAFTSGADIFFSNGSYDPGSSSGRELIAHELTHVVQHSTGRSGPAGRISHTDDSAEQEARSVARDIAANQPAELMPSAPPTSADSTAIARTPARRQLGAALPMLQNLAGNQAVQRQVAPPAGRRDAGQPAGGRKNSRGSKQKPDAGAAAQSGLTRQQLEEICGKHGPYLMDLPPEVLKNIFWRLPLEVRQQLRPQLPAEMQAELGDEVPPGILDERGPSLSELSPEKQASLIKDWDPDEIARLATKLPAEVLMLLIPQLSTKMKQRVLPLVPPEVRKHFTLEQSQIEDHLPSFQDLTVDQQERIIWEMPPEKRQRLFPFLNPELQRRLLRREEEERRKKDRRGPVFQEVPFKVLQIISDELDPDREAYA